MTAAGLSVRRYNRGGNMKAFWKEVQISVMEAWIEIRRFYSELWRKVTAFFGDLRFLGGKKNG